MHGGSPENMLINGSACVADCFTMGLRSYACSAAASRFLSEPVFLYLGGDCMVPDFITKIEQEIKALEYELHNELPKEIQRARELGDLSENAEYAAAKERQDLVNAMIARKRRRLAELSMVDFTKISRDAIGLGSTVKVYDLGSEREISYKLVASEEADAPNGKISTTSPIGRALMGKKDGDVVEVRTPGGEKELEIREFATVHDQKG